MKIEARILLALVIAASTYTPVDAGTNFPAVNDYPLPNCAKPGPAPVMPADRRQHNANSLIDNGQDGDAVTDYNERLARYNEAKLAYHACISAYVANAQVDLGLIQSKAGKPVPNLPALKDYPSPECGDVVHVPAEEGGSMDSLGQRVGNYNAAMMQYNKYITCMNTYMANVQADTGVIQSKVNEAIADSNNDR